MATFEQQRRENIEDNKHVLAEINTRLMAEMGLTNPMLKDGSLGKDANNNIKQEISDIEFNVLPQVSENRGKKRRAKQLCPRRGTRRSARLLGQPSPKLEDLAIKAEGGDLPKKKENNNSFGSIEGVEVGMSWRTHLDYVRDGIHRRLDGTCNVHACSEGAYSIVLSDGYGNNTDQGECFTYTGKGGTQTKVQYRRTAAASKALNRSMETGRPVRVIRGYNLASDYAPEEGYRYDGLYTVKEVWNNGWTGCAAHSKFTMRRCDNQAPPPWAQLEHLEGWFIVSVVKVQVDFSAMAINTQRQDSR